MGSTEQKLEGPDFAAGVSAEDVAEGKPVRGHFAGEPVMLVRVGREVHAIGANCTHYGGPLNEGLVAGHTVRCPWHHACFDVRSGVALGGPALNDLPCYDVRAEGKLVRLTGKTSADEITKTERRSAAGVEPESVVVVGAGPAGAACVEALRKEGYAKTITLIGAEPPGPVDRPNLSKDYLAGNAPEEWIPLRSKEFYEEQAIGFKIDTVRSIDIEQKTVTLASGGQVSYGALVLATGAEPIRLPIEGASLPHVHVLRTLADSRGIIAGSTDPRSGTSQTAKKTAKRVVVIGASFIGLEAAASLRSRGLEVTIVGPETIPLARVLGDEVGKFVQRIHESKGEIFKLGRKPAKITDKSVVLDDGEELAADLVVMGVGVKPRTDLAEAAGLKVDRGIVVDERFRASNDRIYAVGDVARFPLSLLGDESVRIEHFSVAERQGRSAAFAMLKRSVDVRDVPFFWSAHHDVTISYVGHAERFDEVVVKGDLEARDAVIGYLEGERVRAIATINRDATSLRAEQAFEQQNQSTLRSLLD
ncbi:MAG TPA: FAD-dependent oxidoreductase [Polyangiaceae bacterium]|jgi:NADPH-dependent 2,4-dienoyl-CoA reductase/sulfur reductase-like enzyme/nitrite reductase/ring-hydroxylating ferredoxin subunit|nr:FAD-dependent oxidoreductase [Polyangiaceae bacterium]